MCGLDPIFDTILACFGPQWGVFQADFGPQEKIVEPTGKPNNKSAHTPSSKDKKRDINPWVYASEGTQLAVTLLLCFFLGYWADGRFETRPWWTLVGAVFGISVGLYNFLKRFLKK